MIGWATEPAKASETHPVAKGKKEKVYLREANYHPDSSQIIVPRDGKQYWQNGERWRILWDFTLMGRLD